MQKQTKVLQKISFADFTYRAVVSSEVSCATVELAVEALGVTTSRIAKTISFAVENYPKNPPPRGSLRVWLYIDYNVR